MFTSYPTEFDTLYALSDLLLMSRHPKPNPAVHEPLPALIERLGQEDPEQRLALVLNGNVFDFGVTPAGLYQDPHEALFTLETMPPTSLEARFLKALANFLSQPNRFLIWITGDRDAALAYPSVQVRLRGLIGLTRDQNARLIFCDDDTGFITKVGGARVLCLHGHEFDHWNAVDQEEIRQRIAAENRGIAVPSATPNPAARLAINLLASMRLKYPWLDLLQPLSRDLIPLLAVLDPTILPKLNSLLDGDAPAETESESTTPRHLHFRYPHCPPNRDRDRVRHLFLEAMEQVRVTRPERSHLDELMRQTEKRLWQGEDPVSLAETADQMLSAGDLSLECELEPLIANENDRLLAARAFLHRLTNGGRSFQLDLGDDQFEKIHMAVDPSIPFVVTGFSQRARALKRPSGSIYFNSGSWREALDLDVSSLDPETFEALWQLLNHVDTGLERLRGQEPLGRPLMRPTRHLICIRADAKGATGWLGEWVAPTKPDANGAEEERAGHFEAVAQSTFRFSIN
ncbi:hypothetical protein SCOR_22075 [Sulfidibacter corallicola]|uniref:Uncharacterized protein n=1 Tax=Sulfidibacter corallicola TaxID=2818388 RepID=A0A8A4TUU3_SULCO|nr:hypothetical protein [Sulfidibacter corallicola]QTD52891.1 hypothetical protein J3U87_10475 [Sulfidibacter corallicola]